MGKYGNEGAALRELGVCARESAGEIAQMTRHLLREPERVHVCPPTLQPEEFTMERGRC